VTVFHLHETGPLRARYEALGLQLLHLPIGPLYSPRTAAQGVRFLRLLRREGIEVAHTHDLYTNIFAAPWARLAGCRVIASRRWFDATPRAGLVPLNRWSYRCAHRVVANSSLGVRIMIDKERVRAARVLELPNFLQKRAFHRVASEPRNARRRSWGVPPGAFIIGTVARFAPVKNHAMAMRALQRLDEDVHLVLIGAGPSRRELEELGWELHVDRRVRFTGSWSRRKICISSSTLACSARAARGLQMSSSKRWRRTVPWSRHRSGAFPRSYLTAERACGSTSTNLRHSLRACRSCASMQRCVSG
jgi:glycosyltransferase involved in cell wall biosynthesis